LLADFRPSPAVYRGWTKIFSTLQSRRNLQFFQRVRARQTPGGNAGTRPSIQRTFQFNALK
jgi:hypothetical protein